MKSSLNYMVALSCAIAVVLGGVRSGDAEDPIPGGGSAIATPLLAKRAPRDYGKRDGSSMMNGLKEGAEQGAREGILKSVRNVLTKVERNGQAGDSVPPSTAVPSTGGPMRAPASSPSMDQRSQERGTAPVAQEEVSTEPQTAAPVDPPGYAYSPDGRRDPFMAIAQDASRAVEINIAVPPLQRVTLSEITLIGVIWGGFGYVAMVQTPDGRGYAVREGTRLGSSEGVVSAINPDGLTVKEPYIDFLGKKEMREQILALHPKVNAE